MNIKRILGDRSQVYIAKVLLIGLIAGASLTSLLMVQQALAQTCSNPGPAESGYQWAYAGNTSSKVGQYSEIYCQWTGGTCNAANVGQSGTFEEVSGSSNDKVYNATYYTCNSLAAPTISIEVYAGACTTRTIHTSWNSISGASSYRLTRGTTVVYTGSSLSYSDNNNGSGLSPGVSYTYTVEARASNGSVLATASDSAAAPSDSCSWATITNISPGTSPANVATGGSLPITADFSWEGANQTLLFEIIVTKPDNTSQTLTYISGPNNTYRAMPVENPGYSYNGSYTFATPGTYTIRYHGLAKNSAQSVGAEPNYTRTVVAGPPPGNFDFSLSNGGGVTVSRGASSGQTITANLIENPSQTVSFSNVSAIPSGVSITMPASCSPDCSRNMTITASSNASLGTYPMTIIGTGGGKERTTTFNLTISDTPPPQPVGVSLTANPTTISPGGISILTWSSTNVTSCSAPWTSSTATSGTQEAGPAATSVYTITCSSPNGSVSDSATVTVTAPPPPASFNYSLSNSGTTNVEKGPGNSYGQNTISKGLISGTTQSVDLSLSGVPSNVSYSIANDTCSPTCTATINFTVATGAPVGDHTITVTGSPLSKQTSFILDITAAPMSVTCVPDPAVTLVGRPVTWTANITGGTSPYAYLWTGSGIPAQPAPTTNPYTVTYTTLGQKTAQVTVNDNAGIQATCNASSVQVNFNPQFEEF